jgi:invasion protein IalB
MPSQRLPARRARRICSRMRSLLLLSSVLFPLLAIGLPASAQQAKHPAAPAKPAPSSTGPKMLGKYDDWTAATHVEGGQTVCYAFTRAQNSAPTVAGRGDVVLTVTERPGGRDAVALSAGFAYAQGAEATLQIDQTGHALYTSQHSAFAREGAVVVAALQKGHQAVIRSPAPRNVQVVDTFSVKGFSAAYAAIVKACPPPR